MSGRSLVRSPTASYQRRYKNCKVRIILSIEYINNNLLLLEGSRVGKGGENEEKAGKMRKRRENEERQVNECGRKYVRGKEENS